MKLLSVNIMDLWANPLEMHIRVFEFCLIEILFEFYPQSDIIELFCLGILKLTKITLALLKSELKKKKRHPHYSGCWFFSESKAIRGISTVVAMWSFCSRFATLVISNSKYASYSLFPDQSPSSTSLHVCSLCVCYDSQFLPLIFGFLPCLSLLCSFCFHS